ncbi:hypothetical protein [Paucisalibacillus sp. EB02]|uniref:DUF6115 domain-containing protein n=1 Tax=Paucisalibacillus sp. EB02 TaxID=1347087 RepID=UPI0004B020BA|nr:hypothetical protein [Paucisalibacillus sp. EB02]
MTSFLFIISFLLHIISFTAIFALNKQLVAAKSTNTSEIVSLMESYLEEIKNENQILQEELSKTGGKSIANPVISKEAETINSPSINKDLDNSFQIPVIDQKVHDEIEVSLPSRILKLHGEGSSVEEIARKLGCGKTEVELIIKFHEKSNI